MKTLITDMDALIRRTLDVERPLVRAMDRRLRDVFYSTTLRKWPVKTGKSKSLLVYTAPTVRTSTGEIEAGIDSPASYTWYINQGSTAKQLIFQPGEAAAEKILTDTADRWAQGRD